RNLPCSTVKAHKVNFTGERFSSSASASSSVSESLPPETATATRSPSRIILNLAMASPTRRKRARSSWSGCFTAGTLLFSLKPELLAEGVDAALDLGIHADHLGPGPREAFLAPFAGGVDAHLRAEVRQAAGVVERIDGALGELDVALGVDVVQRLPGD